MFRRADLPCRIVPVTITGGDRQSPDGGHWRVPKRDLITGLMLLFQSEKITMQNLPRRVQRRTALP